MNASVPVTCAFFATAILALALPCFLYDLNLPDEPRVAHTSFEMLRTGDFVLPAVNGEAFLQTPPLFYWLPALWFDLAGTAPEGAARVVPVCCGVGTLLVTYLLARRYAGWAAGLLSAAVLLAMFHFWDIGHRVTVDMCLTLFTNMAFFCLALLVLEARSRWWWGPLFGIFAGGAFLVKGVVGPVFLSLTVIAVFLRHRDLWTRSRAVALAAAVLAAAVVLLPWIAALYARDPAYPSELVLEHVWRRATGDAQHDPSNWQFLHRMLLHLMPWTVLLPFVLYGEGRRVWARSRAARASETDERRGRFVELLLFFFLLSLAVLLISRSKRDVYLLPALPAVAMLTGTWLARQLETVWLGRVARAGIWILAALVPVGLIATLMTTAGKSSGLLVLGLVAHFYWLVRWYRSERRRRRESDVDRALNEPETAPARGELSSTVYTALPLVILCVASWGSFYHVMRNPRYTAAPLGREVAALASRGHEITGYRLWEREIAAVAWYLRHPFRHVTEGEKLTSLLAPGATADSRDRRLALVVEASELEALAANLSGWKEVVRSFLRRRELVVLVRPGNDEPRGEAPGSTRAGEE